MKTRFWVLIFAVALFVAACGGKSDADLKAAADAALKSDPATSTVTVEVKDGVATISGQVETEEAKTKAAEAAKVEGVKSVTNDVNVTPPPPKASAEDPEMKTKVEDALKAKNCGAIEVEVKDGTVTLRGSVKKDKLAECMMAAQETKPKNVVNQLKVE